MASKDLILIDLGAARIKRFDERNLVVEKLVKMPAAEFRNPATGERFFKPNREEWVEDGYFGGVKDALRHIYIYDLCIEEKQRTLEEYIAIHKEILRKLRKWGL